MSNKTNGVKLSEYQELLKEWDYEKNSGCLLEDFSAFSSEKVYWRCKKCGGSWLTTIATRTRGRGCPYCSGKKMLKRFNDLQTLRPKIAKEWDFDKNNTLPSQFTAKSNQSVWWKCKNGHSWKSKIAYRTQNKNHISECPYCSNRYVLAGFNDLLSKRPDIAKEWNYEKNDNLTPEMVTSGSSKKVWWKCYVCGHEWKTTIDHRTHGRRCPICANKLKGRKK